MKKISLLFVALFALTTSMAQADLLLEPVVGYNFAGKVSNDNESYSGGMGLGYGGRVGYQNLGFQLGLDYLASSIDMDDADYDSNVDTADWAAFVGFKFPILLRVYAGYVFSSTGTTKYLNQDLDISKGSGTKFGVGFTGLPFININLEYRKITYSEMELGGAEVEQDVDSSAVFLGISLPFAI